MDSPALWIGMLACAGATGAALAPLPARARLSSITVALLLAPILLAADNWNGSQLVELRDAPAAAAVALVAAAAAVVALAFLFARRPLLLPLALVAVLPFRIPVELGSSTSNLLLPLYAVLAAGVLAFWMSRFRTGALPPSPSGPGLGRRWARLVGGLLGVIVVLYALQAGYADDLSSALETLSFFLAPFAALFLLLSWVEWDRRLLRLALTVATVEALIVALVGFGQYATGEVFWNEKVIDGNEAHAYFRVNSLFFDPNIMGRYLAVTMVLLAGVVAWGRRIDARNAALAFGVLLLALIATVSMTSMLALVGGLLALGLARWGLARGLAATLLTMAALALVVVGLSGDGLTAETTGRTGLVSGGVELFEDQPLVGSGSGSFAREFEGRYGGGDGIAVESHTEPITVAAEQGVVGLLPYVALLALVVGGLWPLAGLGLAPASGPLLATLLAALVAMIAHSLGYAAFFSDPITWLLLALAATLASTTVAQPSSARRLRDPAPEPVR